jgi:hypothetical protein
MHAISLAHPSLLNLIVILNMSVFIQSQQKEICDRQKEAGKIAVAADPEPSEWK